MENRKRDLSRRAFLGIGGVAAASVAAASLAACGPSSPSDKETAPEGGTAPAAQSADLGGSIAVMHPIADTDISETIDYDVVVIGGGLSGGVAAAKASEGGKKVAVLQKAEVAISNGAGGAAWNSKMQQELGVEFDPWEAVIEWTRQGENRADLDLLKTWIYNSGPAMDWLIPLTNDVEGVGPVICGLNAGMDYPDAWNYAYGTVHMWIGQMQALAQWCLDYTEQNGGTVYYSTPGVQILREGDKSGKITAVIGLKEDGTYIKLNAASVILAAGDYGNNPVLRAQYLPHAEGLITAYMRPDINTGDGQYMGTYIGGKMQLAPHCSNIHYDPPTEVPDVPGSGIPWLFVNKNGKRFCNEDVQYGQLYAQAMNQPDFTHYQIFDENFRTDWEDMGSGMMKKEPPVPIVEGVDQGVVDGKVLKADTIADLAAAIKVDAIALQATVDRYNVLVDAGYDDDYGKQAGRLKAIKVAPFYAIARKPNVLCTLNGIITNGKCEALDENHQVIEGLYAVGNCQGNFFGGLEHQMVIPGMSIGRAITTGYVAGLLTAGGEIAKGRI
ncbi:MAG: FAD-binding protein [Coriobacteriales bacterium]|jgi:fumarate reductase flavoprotein subunit|nr:FAD-binding protein [Coriobacteriales bacterium]